MITVEDQMEDLDDPLSPKGQNNKPTELSAQREIFSPNKIIKNIKVSPDAPRMLKDRTKSLFKTLPLVDQIDCAF